MKGTDSDSGSETLRRLKGLHICNGRIAARNLRLNRRRADHFAVIDNGNLQTEIFPGRLRELLRALVRQGQGHLVGVLAQVVRIPSGLGAFNVRSLNEHISSDILKLQRAGPSKLLQNGIGVGHTGNLDVNPVPSLLVNHGLGAVALHTLLELIDRIIHLLLGGIVNHRLISDADTAGQVQAQLNIFRRAGPGLSKAYGRTVEQSRRNQSGEQQG